MRIGINNQRDHPDLKERSHKIFRNLQSITLSRKLMKAKKIFKRTKIFFGEELMIWMTHFLKYSIIRANYNLEKSRSNPLWRTSWIKNAKISTNKWSLNRNNSKLTWTEFPTKLIQRNPAKEKKPGPNQQNDRFPKPKPNPRRKPNKWASFWRNFKRPKSIMRISKNPEQVYFP